ncbi:restriction endonuclease subunit S [Paraburkholderia hospita]|uniref:restriction endonuclease subunit S n=1 Tax=Paraburkholderia hospita TaxID=169430 RepID=UPI000B345573|nr:restriction endonuclease subunit S [Paraburkholderia hospita]OUL72173.1 hypothetical protein CA603_46295 [Paraburkholderia hospita]
MSSKPLLLPLFSAAISPDRSWERLDGVADVFDCPHSTPRLVDEATAPYVVRSQDVRSGTFLFRDAAHVSIETYEERVKRVEPRYGDLLYSREGTYFGIAAEVPKGMQVCLGQRMVLIRPDPSLIDHRYLKYWLNSPQVFGHIHGFRDGTVAERLNLPVIRGLAIAVPTLARQQAIAETLSVLDDRITLLGETNASLEAIAQALFKSWFVDFDPVRAKQEGRMPEGMDETTATLFPDGFEESALGTVPNGWHLTTLADAFEINPKRTLKKGTLAPYVDMASVPTVGHCVVSAVNRAMGSGSKFQNGDSLLARITPCLENGKSAFVDFLEPGQTGWGSTEFIVLRPKAPLPVFHGYLLCRHTAFREFAIQSMSGTSGRQRVTNDVLARYLVARPSDGVSKAFAKVVEPLQSKITANNAQISVLADLRDTLIPRLISGQLRSPESGALAV